MKLRQKNYQLPTFNTNRLWRGYTKSITFAFMTERELRKLEATIRTKMEDIKKQRVSLRDSGIGGLMNSLKKIDEALYEKILPEYKKMVTDYNIFK